MRFTFGITSFDDYDGTFFSHQAIRANCAGLMQDSEIVVVDNNPHGQEAEATAHDFTRIKNGRYIPFSHKPGTAQPRNKLFEEARGEWVVVMDCHVLMDATAMPGLLKFIEADPFSSDLLQGPLVGVGDRIIGTHQDQLWRNGAIGTWGIDKRGVTPDLPPFSIPQQGMGFFACRRDAWPEYHQEFSGWGGSETYIAEKFKRRGDRVMCLPAMRWRHRFTRIGGVPYRLDRRDQFRNYSIGFQELAMYEELTNLRNHYLAFDEQTGQQILAEQQILEIEEALGMMPPPPKAARGGVTVTRDYSSYPEYLEHQASKGVSPRWRKMFAAHRSDRVAWFCEHVVPHARELPTGATALCIGARYGEEVQALRESGYRATGIDLNPLPPLVERGDMNNLHYPDASWDLVYCNSLDHAWDVRNVARELVRITRAGGRIVVHAPYGDQPEAFERWRWDDPSQVVKLFPKNARVVQQGFLDQPFWGMVYEFALEVLK